jgi:hypothetical protein
MLRQILIDTRDHVYHYSKKQNGSEIAKRDYMFKMMGSLICYYLGVLMLLAHLISNFFSFQFAKNMNLLIRFVVGMVICVIPVWLIVKYVLHTVRSEPIPENLTKQEYNRKRVISLAVLFSGMIFLVISAILPAYLMGAKIHLGDYIIQRK